MIVRILIDTNVLFSALLFPRSKPAIAVLHIARNHTIVLCKQNVEELREIIKRKAPAYLPYMEKFLAELTYELLPVVDRTLMQMRDVKDQPILNTAIVNDVDIIVTGDKDFLSLELERPKCMSVAKFLEIEAGRLSS